MERTLEPFSHTNTAHCTSSGKSPLQKHKSLSPSQPSAQGAGHNPPRNSSRGTNIFWAFTAQAVFRAAQSGGDPRPGILPRRSPTDFHELHPPWRIGRPTRANRHQVEPEAKRFSAPAFLHKICGLPPKTAGWHALRRSFEGHSNSSAHRRDALRRKCDPSARKSQFCWRATVALPAMYPSPL